MTALRTCGLALATLVLVSPALAQQRPHAAELAPSPPAHQPVLHEIAASPQASRLEADVQRLVGFGTRHTLSDTVSDTRGIGAARRWIRAEFEAISAACGGCLEVVEQRGVVSGHPRIPDATEIVNVYAVLRGTTDPERYVIMSGDIDSRVTDVMDAVSESPGANDNASGMAAAIELARVLSQYRFNASIVLAGLSGEEQGLFGGEIMAEQAIRDGWRIQAVLNNDMVGNVCGITGVCDNTTARVFAEGTRVTESPREATIRRYTGGEVDSPSRNLARYIKRVGEAYVPNLSVMMVYRLDRFGRGGHHRPFNDVGLPAVRIMETHEHYDRQHQDLRVEDGRHFGDTIEFVDFDYAAKLTALNAVALASMAWAPAPPSNVQISGAVQPHTTLRWDAVSRDHAPNLAGYTIYWRLTTEPEWTHRRWVGDVTEFTLENVVIDNYFFGVASVSEDGFESPVVFPGAAGNFDRLPPPDERASSEARVP
jgi:hypothetical protein